ncbi:hypothetical protein [Saccharibacillus kuerlensis]|uniref:Uncharacterized protein n=1 Tax=Saccharibacillus kuerlensis TaxID=459527 RepID=A0ABQ2KZK5_9BACL|nr:hypothetical protein [Saccharibacillus kuerlensis]GGN97689.1 hypothetical protein GCM10010969_15800 [Saccharibacillus kuerlensis]
MWRLFFGPKQKKRPKVHMPTQEEVEEMWYRYFYETHPRLELKEWARRMHIFRFCRANADQTGDRDRLMAAFRFSSSEELENLCAELGIALESLPETDAASAAADRFRIPDYPNLRQPGHLRLFGLPAHVWVRRERLIITISDADKPFDVTPRTVKAVEKIETKLGNLTDRIVDPPLNDKHCLCPKFYPEYFS